MSDATFAAREEARLPISESIEGFYYRQRIQGGFNSVSPEEFEATRR